MASPREGMGVWKDKTLKITNRASAPNARNVAIVFSLFLEHSGEASEVGTNLGTIAIIQASDDVPVNNFAFELSLALNTIGE